MRCRDSRSRLGRSGSGALAPELERHLSDCAACARIAERWAAAGRLLAEPGASAEPDAGFAARVVANLPQAPDVMGWAAVRLLPATLALALVLSAWCLYAVPGPASLLDESPVDDPLGWSVGSVETGS